MYIKIHTPPSYGGNKGSCSNLIQYLDKENRYSDELEQVGFFSHTENNVQPEEVERIIDANKGKLGKDDAKFYMISVNPSERELAHISSNEEALKLYVRNLMDEYAKNFNREYEEGVPLQGKDLIYYAKIEHERTYKFSDKRYRSAMEYNKGVRAEIIKNMNDNEKVAQLQKQYIRDSKGTVILEGNVKEGNNMHVHIVVSRYDKEQKFKLSPLANQRGGKGVLNGKEHIKGFNRDAFVSTAEKLFDKQFSYQRNLRESYNYNLWGKIPLGALVHPEAMVKILVKRAILESIRDKTLQKSLQMAVTNPKYIPKSALQQVEREAAKKVAEMLGKGAYTNPVTAGVQVAKEAIIMVGKYISKSASI